MTATRATGAAPMEQLIGFVDFERKDNPRRVHIADWALQEIERLHALADATRIARPLCEWHEDIGPVLWWAFPINEAPWCGTPLADDWPHYHTHWTPLVVPDVRAATVCKRGRMMEQQALNLPGPRISRITLARLHNLGNYEHVRYEVTVELPPGTSPASVARELEDTLNALEPKQPVSDWDLRQAVKLLATPEPTLQPLDDEEDFMDPAQVLRREQAERERARIQIGRHQDWLKSRDAALRRLDELGGSSQSKDAKDRWDEQ